MGARPAGVGCMRRERLRRRRVQQRVDDKPRGCASLSCRPSPSSSLSPKPTVSVSTLLQSVHVRRALVCMRQRAVCSVHVQRALSCRFIRRQGLQSK